LTDAQEMEKECIQQAAQKTAMNKSKTNVKHNKKNDINKTEKESTIASTTHLLAMQYVTQQKDSRILGLLMLKSQIK